MKQYFNQGDKHLSLKLLLLNKVITQTEYDGLKKKQSQSISDMMLKE